VAQGKDNLNHAAIATVVEQLSGIEVKRPKD
jgi:hypothetical protein